MCARQAMRVVDAFCGAGGWSAGAIAAGCTPVLGIDSDAAPLKLWATNCSPAGRAVCATIGEDAVEWPEAAPDVHVTHTVHTNGVELPQRPTSTTRP